MPKFMDFHESIPEMSPEQAQGLMAAATEKIKAGQADDSGVVPLNVFFGSGGQAYCLSEAPNVEAVVKSHDAVGISQESRNIHEVNSLV